MNPDQIKALIRQEVAAQASANRFTLTPASTYTKNNVDTTYSFQPILTYIGNINSNGTIKFLPSGWTVSHPSAGVYTVTHNLGTKAYAVTANCISTLEAVMVSDYAPNTFTVNIGNPANGNLFSSEFFFILVVPKNRSVQIPNYVNNL